MNRRSVRTLFIVSWVVAALAAIAATPTAAGQPAVSTGTLTMVIAHDPNSIDPHVHDGWYSVRYQSPVYEALVDTKWNPEKKVLEFLPMLATSWEISRDGLTYTFKLRKGVKFHDGHPFTAEAVKVTFDRNRELKLRAAYQVEPIKELQTPDDYTVVMKLKYPFTPFLMAMARAYIMSPKAIKDNAKPDDKWAQKWFNQNMVGTGPYSLKQFAMTSIGDYVKNPNYWRGWSGKHFDRILMKHVVERSTQALLIEKGDVDVADEVPLDDLSRLAKLPGIRVENNPSPMPFAWMLRPRGPLADVRVRQALNYAVPHDDLIEKTMGGAASRIYGPLTSAYSAYCEKDLIKYNFDLNKAKALLKEAGYEKGFDLNFTTAAQLPWEKDIGVILQGIWAQLGIKLRIEEFASSPAHMSASYTWEEPKKFDAFGMVISAYLPDPDHQLWRWIGEDNIGGLNVSYYRNAKLNGLFRQAKTMPFGPERDKVYCEASVIINHDAVHLWVLSKNDVRVFRSNIKGHVYNPADPILEYRWYELYRE